VRLMRAEGLKARVRKRFHSTTMSDHGQPIAGNVLDRQFVAERDGELVLDGEERRSRAL